MPDPMTNHRSLDAVLGGMAEATLARFGDLWWENTVANRPAIDQSIFEAVLKREGADRTSAVVVAHGPSLKRRNSLETLRESGYRGVIIAVDSAAAECLRHGIVPDCVVCADPRPRMVHSFGGDEERDRLLPDDERYYKSMADESHLGPDPLATSRTNRELFDRYGSRTIGLFSTSVSPRVTERCREMGLDTYWWNPMYDDYDASDSLTRRVYDHNSMPCVNAGGNVGTAAWVMAHSVLEVPRVGLVGMDFAYYAGTPPEKTQYYHELLELYGPDGMGEMMPDSLDRWHQFSTVRMSPYGTKRTSDDSAHMSANDPFRT